MPLSRNMMTVYNQFYRLVDKAVCEGRLTEPFNSKNIQDACDLLPENWSI